MNIKFNVRLTIDAKVDIEDIYNYLLAERGQNFAISFIDNMLLQITTLEQFPERCPFIAELSGIVQFEFRQLINFHYLIIFQILEAEVIIMLITDGRRDLQTLLEQRVLQH